MRRVVLAMALVVSAFVPGTSHAADLVVTVTPGGPFAQYVPRYVVVPQGFGLQFVQADPLDAHNVVSSDVRNGRYLFESDTVGVSEITPVKRVEQLSVGTYPFLCSMHPLMYGVLMVV